jgi:pimeloyl-ACP methyl ester carboxylesterase
MQTMAETVDGGLRCHYKVIGPTPVRVVFVHGLVLDNLSSFYFTLAAPVAQDVGVLLYDLRGHGKSERPASGYSVPRLVADLDELLTTLGIEHPVHLVGNSFGGLMTMAFAVAHPERVAGLILIDSHIADEGWGERMATTLSLTGAERVEKIVDTFKDWSGRNSRRKRGRLADNARALIEGTTLIADMRASPAMDEEQLRAIRCPILALYGAGSEILEHGRRIVALAPHAELRLLDGASHLVLFEATTALRAEVRAWLAEHP